jgi:precorrin-2 dehydrogenase
MGRLFPIFVKLEGRNVLVVGAGKIGEGKIQGLLESGASMRVVAPEASQRVREWARSGAITLEQRVFSSSDLDGVFLVIVATRARSVNEEIFREATLRGILCNVVDVPELCDFFYPAVVRRGDLQVAISTGGQSPILAQKLRQQLERQFPAGYGEWVARLGRTRRQVLRSDLAAEEKRFLLQSLASEEAFRAMVLSKRISKPEGEAA